MKCIFIFDQFFVINSSYKNIDDVNLIKDNAEKVVFENNEYYISSNENLNFSLSDYNVYLSTSWCIAELGVLPAVRGFEYRALMDGYNVSNATTKKFFNSCIKEKGRDRTIVQNVYLVEDSRVAKIKNSNANVVNNFALSIPVLFKLEGAWSFISCMDFNKEKKYTVYTGYGKAVSSVNYVNNIDTLRSVIQYSKDCLRQSLKKDISDVNIYSVVDLSDKVKDIEIKYLNNNGDIGIINSIVSKNIVFEPKIFINSNKFCCVYKSESNKILIFTIFVLLLITGYLLFQNCKLRNNILCIDDQIERLISNNKCHSEIIKKNLKKDILKKDKFKTNKTINKFDSGIKIGKDVFIDTNFDDIFNNFDEDFVNTRKTLRTINDVKVLSNNPNDCFSEIEFIIPKDLRILSYEYKSSVVNGDKKENLILIVKDDNLAVQNFINNLSRYSKNLKIANIEKNKNGTLTINMSNN